MTAELVCVGLATTDLIIELPRWPDPDGRLVVDPIRRSGGGPAATAAVAASRLGRRVAFVGAVGRDEGGSAALEDLRAVGVDVGLVEEQDGGTAESVILLDRSTATRSIIHAPGVTLARLAARARESCEAAAWVHVDHAGWPLVRGMSPERISIDAGNPIDGLDLAGIGLYGPTESALLERFAGRSLGSAVASALEAGAERVAVTLGGRGAVAADRTGAWRVGPVTVEIVSTLGAGDVFHGALLAALLGGDSLPEALRAANVAAALSCRGVDGREAIPTTDELRAALGGAPAPEPFLLDEEP